MLFNSIAFLVFFPIVTALYFWAPLRRRVTMLLVASSVFYMMFVPSYILILGFTIVVDYFAGILIEQRHGRSRRLWLMASIVANVSVLAIFKYYGFLTGNVNTLAALMKTGFAIPPLNILLPIGLSFHTFQAMSYTIEVYRGHQKAERDFLTYALYVMFYPQLVAGPIERPQNLLPQFRVLHRFDYVRVVGGLQRMAIGMFKKVVIADTLAPQVDRVYDAATQYTGLPLIIATFFFAFQIYYDFSGYTDIALGSAQVMGFKLMENFRVPYVAKSISEFWSRWHISLSTWFRDYVYIPLGGNRTSRPRWYFNLLVVFLISGLWHGANWTFIIWGGLHGVYLVIGQITGPVRERLRTRLSTFIPRFVLSGMSMVTVFLLVGVAWVFFRATSLHTAWYIVTHLTTGLGAQIRDMLAGGPLPGTFNPVAVMLSLGLIVGATAVEYIAIEKRGTREFNLLAGFNTPLRYAVYLFLIYGSLMFGASSGEHQFIYFQF